VANHHQNGGRHGAHPEENRSSWRPQDQPPSQSFHGRGNDDDRDYRSWRDRNYHEDDASDRDPRRWEGSRGSELGYFGERGASGRFSERYGQGQSGYTAGRYADDRAPRMPHRNEIVPSSPTGYGDRYIGSYEDRYHDLATDDRFAGGGASAYWLDRGGADANAHRYGHSAGGAWSGPPSSYGYDERIGYQGSAGQGTAQMGHQGYAPQRHASPYPGQRSPEPGLGHLGHVGTGPHRGKGPSGYQRSDARLRELICESLTDDDQLDASHIEVVVKNAEVTLSGSVDDRRAKRDAEDCAASIWGVRDIQNQLRVRDDRLQSGKSGQTSSGQIASGPSPGHAANGTFEPEALSPDKKPRA